MKSMTLVQILIDVFDALPRDVAIETLKLLTKMNRVRTNK
jgi:hypothetical protein